MSVARLSARNHPLYEIFSEIDELVWRFVETPLNRRGRPQQFSDAQIMKCLVYQVYYRIRCFRELEWKLKHDYWALRTIGLNQVPDHTTFCRRTRKLEENLYYPMYQEILSELEPQTRICFWDSTALRASRYDRDAEKGKGTRLGWFYGYKLHAIVSEDLLPLVFDLTPAGFYDNQVPYLVRHLVNHDVFFLLADAAYDDKNIFSACKQAEIYLATQVNMRNASSPKSFKDFCRRQNWLFVNRGLGKNLLPKRNGIERLFSTLKTIYGLEQPRLYGISRYLRHVLWVILVYLLDRLVDKRKGSRTRKAPWNR
jgi:Transposase DDE domain/Transposase domain (DUF772)